MGNLAKKMRGNPIEQNHRIVGQIRERWPRAKILLRADSGFARDELPATS